MKSRNILILALIMGLVTTFLFGKYLKDLDTKYKKNENKISVVVPKQVIKKNQKVTKDMLQYKEFHADSVHPEAIKKIEQVEGNYALTDINEGEFLFPNKFTNQFQETELLTRKIRDGYRAVSIEANLVESVTNSIQPEDYVDVIFSEKVKSDATNYKIITDMLLPNIRVLAVGKRLTEKATQNKDSKGTDQKENQVEYTAVTLELKPEDAIKLINADERGNIKFTLRSKVVP